jgi:hypothetical protein
VHNFGKCGSLTQKKIIVCPEKGRKFIGLNRSEKEILQVKVDHCLEIVGKRCDWLLIDIVDHFAHFIELKGCEVKQALLQLENSIMKISSPQNGYIEKEFNRKNAYIILSRTQISSVRIQNAKINFKKRYKTTLIIKNNRLEQKL